MTTQTTRSPLPTTDRPRHRFLSVFLPTALTLAAVLSIGVWLFRGGDSDAPVTTSAAEQYPAPISEIHTGRERGGLAEMQEDLSRQPAPRPYTVYLVESAERLQAMTNLGLAEGEVVLLAGTPEEQATANAHIEVLETNAGLEPVARAVRVIDLRPSPGPVATAPVPALGGPAAAAGTVSDQEMYGRWQADQQGTAIDAPHPRQTEVVQTVYLAGSAEQAETIRQGIAEAEAIRAAVGAPPLMVHPVVLVIPTGEETQILRALGDSDAIRDSLGLPGLVVVDLRTPA